MRPYESTFILIPTLDAKGVTHEVDGVKEIITSHGGEITAEKEWGRRRLAYPIRDFQEGVYHILRFNLGNDGLKELGHRFKLNESVLRFLVIKDEGTPIEYTSNPYESEERDYEPRGRRGGNWDSGGDRSRDFDSDSRDSRDSRGGGDGDFNRE